MAVSQDWKVQSAKARAIQQDSIPKQWLVDESKLPPPEQKSVLDFARTSGALSEKELSITAMSAGELVAQMRTGKLSAEEVVVAFLKRGVIGQQLVYTCMISYSACIWMLIDSSTLLPNSWRTGLLHAPKNWTSIIDRRASWLGHWWVSCFHLIMHDLMVIAWGSYQRQGTYWRQGLDAECLLRSLVFLPAPV